MKDTTVEAGRGIRFKKCWKRTKKHIGNVALWYDNTTRSLEFKEMTD